MISTIVKVELGKKSYEIIIGNNLQNTIISYLRKKNYSRQALIITDSNVEKLYGEQTIEVLSKAGLNAYLWKLQPGEQFKNLSSAEILYNKCIEYGLDRQSPIFALGGGVVGDLAGFVAATYMRGIPFIQLPTSLLAQVDSSVGGKVAVNNRLGKNLIGVFYQPQIVFIDLDFLFSLPKREILTGLGEVFKYGFIYDKKFLEFLEKNVSSILKLESKVMSQIIAHSCAIKAEIVSIDERELGLRRILNFGHTIGHAIEKETGYIRYNHGEAVVIGMLGALTLSCSLGILNPNILQHSKQLLELFGFLAKAKGCTVDALYADIFRDKKTVDGQVNWILLTDIGKAVCRNDVPERLVREAIASCVL